MSSMSTLQYFRCWAKLMHRRAHHHIEDALIAATAVVYDLTIATRNTKDFKSLDVDLINPFC
jgi:toxin FitB